MLSFLRRGWEALTAHQEWRVGIVEEDGTSWPLEPRPPRVRWLPLPRFGEYIADPFPVRWGQRTLILAEHFSHRDRIGRIVAVDPASGAPPMACDFGVPAGTHMSYPFPVVDERGDLYCVPETHQLHEVALYAPSEFPARWTRSRQLISGIAALDPTPFRHEGSWWMFFTIADGRANDRELHLWFADHLGGPWLPHPANPVKRDIGSARPAGTPFVHQGCVYRPAQDCSRRYGGRLVLNRIVALDRRAFREETAAHIEPLPDRRDGLHTLAFGGGMTVIDGNRVRFVPAASVGALRRALARLRGATAPLPEVVR